MSSKTLDTRWHTLGKVYDRLLPKHMGKCEMGNGITGILLLHSTRLLRTPYSVSGTIPVTVTVTVPAAVRVPRTHYKWKPKANETHLCQGVDTHRGGRGGWVVVHSSGYPRRRMKLIRVSIKHKINAGIRLDMLRTADMKPSRQRTPQNVTTTKLFMIYYFNKII